MISYGIVQESFNLVINKKILDSEKKLNQGETDWLHQHMFITTQETLVKEMFWSDKPDLYVA